MAENFTPVLLTQINGSVTSAVTSINANFETIAAILTDVLSLSGTSPNQMQSSLDMNSNQILNLPAPTDPSSPVRLQDLDGVTVIPTTLILTNATGLPLTTGVIGVLPLANLPTIPTSQLSGTIATTNLTGTLQSAQAPAYTGDATSTAGALALTLATVNSGPGSVGSSTAIPVITTNGKGLVTAQSTAAVVAPAGTLTGTALASNVVSSSLTSVGTLATGAVPTTLLTGTLQAAQEPAHTGDATNTAGSLVLTLATVNSNTGAFGSSTAIPIITTNGKGLVTAVSTAAVVAPAGTLSGSTLAAGVTSSSLTAVGTLTSITTSGNLTFTTAGDGMVGTTTNNNASTGIVGELVAVTIASGSSISLTNSTPTNITTMTLTAGDWDVWGAVAYNCAGTTTRQYFGHWISNTSATFQAALLYGAVDTNPSNVAISGIDNSYVLPTNRWSLASTTTFYLSCQAGFGVSTCKAYGAIVARRHR